MSMWAAAELSVNTDGIWIYVFSVVCLVFVRGIRSLKISTLHYVKCIHLLLIISGPYIVFKGGRPLTEEWSLISPLCPFPPLFLPLHPAVPVDVVSPTLQHPCRARAVSTVCLYSLLIRAKHIERGRERGPCLLRQAGRGTVDQAGRKQDVMKKKKKQRRRRNDIADGVQCQ